MIEKRKNCTYCGKEMVSATAKKRFCSDKCRVYYSREKERGTLESPKIIDDILTTEINKPVSEKTTSRYYEPPKLKEEVITNVEKKEAPKFRVITLEERIAAMEAAKNKK